MRYDSNYIFSNNFEDFLGGRQEKYKTKVLEY